MRHWLLALMIALLPLRSWAGDAMATEMAIIMATNAAVTAKTIATEAHKTSLDGLFGHEVAALTTPVVAAQAHPDCNGHGLIGAAPAIESHQTSDMQDTHSAQEEHCTPCQACQACHTVALSPSAARLMALFAFQGQPDIAALPFVNADAALSQKPPIS